MAVDTRKRVDTAPPAAGEKLMSWIWERQRLRPGLRTTDGEPLQVAFPGRRNGLGGPDFRRAILTASQVELRGDVELHLRSSLWRAHGHQRDPAYNGVVLHVVMWDDSSDPISLRNGRRVPTLALAPYLLGNEGTSDCPEEPCRRRPVTASRRAAPEEVLDRLGEERFRAGAARFRARLETEEAGQALYEGVMTALGYSRNQEAFLELARRLCLAEAEAAARSRDIAGLKGFVLGWAGLAGPAPAPDLPPIRWQTQGVRPVNQPARRLEALCCLLVRYSGEGWMNALMGAVQRAALAARKGQLVLEQALMVTAPEAGDGGPLRPALLGKERAAEIAVNVLLPFAYASGLQSQALSLYRSYPCLEENEVTREMSSQLGIDRKTVSSACRQQGLIHLFKAYCSDRNCRACPLGAPKKP